MANLKSSKKDIRRIAVRTVRNVHVKSRLKTMRRRLSDSLAANDEAEARTASRAFLSAIDKAAKRRIIHPNKADRLKAALSRHAF
jgi:small subunit ribosomal protein S20